jgi:hypothetical protein
MTEKLLPLLQKTASLLRPLSLLATIWALAFYVLRIGSYTVQSPFTYLVPLSLLFGSLSLALHLWDMAYPSSNLLRYCLLPFFYLCNIASIGILAATLLLNDIRCGDVVFQLPYLALYRRWSPRELYDYARKFLGVEWQDRFIHHNIDLAAGSMEKFRARFQCQFQEIKNLDDLAPVVLTLLMVIGAASEYPMSTFRSVVEWLFETPIDTVVVPVPADNLGHLLSYLATQPTFVYATYSFLFAAAITSAICRLLPRISKAKESKLS